MPPRIASLTDLLNSLDAATYFFVSSSMIIAISAVLFFGLGLWLGQILWRRYKRHFRQSEEIIESYKGEVAQLKRRLAEQSTRPLPGMGPSPLHSIAFRAAAPRPTPPVGDKVPPLEVPFVPKVPVVAVNPTNPRPETGEKNEAGQEGKPVPGGGSEGPDEASAKEDATTPNVSPTYTSASLHWPGKELLFAPSDVLLVPRSRAFCLWTENDWQPPAITSAPVLPARGFVLWTEPDFEPACSGPRWPSRAHTVWTSPGWTSSYTLGPPTRSARAFTIWIESGWKSPWTPRASKAFSLWTEEGWTPTPVLPLRLPPAKSFSVWTEAGWQRMLLLPWSKAFSLWTDPDWSPSPVKGAPWPASEAGSVWTSSEFVPACRGALLPSRAFTKWTEKGWSPPSLRRCPLPAGKSFTLWAEPDPVVAPTRAWFTRTLAAAKQALGLIETTPSVATPDVNAPDLGASTETPREANKAPTEPGPKAAVAPSYDGPLPPSRAFTLWGEVPGSERATPADEQVAAGSPAEANGRRSSLISPLDLEPLSVPGEG